MTAATTQQGERTQAVSFLASFVPPQTAARRAEQLAPGAAASDAGVLELVVAHVRDELGVPAAMIASVLHHEAGVPSSRAAALAGLSVREVNELLDRGDALDVAEAPAPSTRERRIGRARVGVRLLWGVLIVLALLAYIDQRGGALPCASRLCIDAVEVVLADDTAVVASADDAGSEASLSAAPVRGEFQPNDIAGLRYTHRSTAPVAVTVIWVADGRELLVQRLSLLGATSTTVVWPGGSMPIGVHQVSLEDDNGPIVQLSFSVELSAVG